ncbi:MAG: hypothetical protein ACI4UV_16095 [Victivallales bacterium]
MMIAILAGLLLPTLNQAKVASGRVACFNNFRQIGTARAHYASDYSDYIAGHSSLNDSNNPGNRHWMKLFLTYTRTAQLWICPGSRDAGRVNVRKLTEKAVSDDDSELVSYQNVGINAVGGITSNRAFGYTFYKEGRIKHAAALIYLGDSTSKQTVFYGSVANSSKGQPINCYIWPENRLSFYAQHQKRQYNVMMLAGNTDSIVHQQLSYWCNLLQNNSTQDEAKHLRTDI